MNATMQQTEYFARPACCERTNPNCRLRRCECSGRNALHSPSQNSAYVTPVQHCSRSAGWRGRCGPPEGGGAACAAPRWSLLDSEAAAGEPLHHMCRRGAKTRAHCWYLLRRPLSESIAPCVQAGAGTEAGPIPTAPRAPAPLVLLDPEQLLVMAASGTGMSATGAVVAPSGSLGHAMHVRLPASSLSCPEQTATSIGLAAPRSLGHATCTCVYLPSLEGSANVMKYGLSYIARVMLSLFLHSAGQHRDVGKGSRTTVAAAVLTCSCGRAMAACPPSCHLRSDSSLMLLLCVP